MVQELSAGDILEASYTLGTKVWAIIGGLRYNGAYNYSVEFCVIIIADCAITISFKSIGGRTGGGGA